MKKLFFIILSVFIILSACKNGDKNDNDAENDSLNISQSNSNGNLEMLTFDKSVLNELDDVKGDFLYGYKWKDKMGLNQLIFTVQNKFVEWKDAEYDDMGDNYRYLRVYHFAGTKNDYSLIREIKDGFDACGSPPFALENEFYKNSISITDLNKNGYAEITFMYYLLCASELTPVTTKLMMLENGEKYAIRGNSYIPEYEMGGEKNLSLKGADQVLKDYASDIWNKFCTPNPKGNSKVKKPTASINFDLIKTLKFGGVEPNWSIKFENGGAKYSAYPGAPEIFLNYEKRDIDNNVFSIIANDRENMESFFITIKQESCTDGMSDKTYPYSIVVRKDNGTLSGCGWK